MNRLTASILATGVAILAGLAIPALTEFGLLPRWAGAILVLAVAAAMAFALSYTED